MLLDLEKEKASLHEQDLKEQEFLDQLQRKASQGNESIQSVDRDMERFTSDSSFFNKQQLHHLSAWESKLKDHVSNLLSYF